jgi:hypothetical protein
MSATNALVIGAISAEGSEPVTTMAYEERGDARAMLQPRLIQVQVHPVDCLDLEQHVASEHIGGRTR